LIRLSIDSKLFYLWLGKNLPAAVIRILMNNAYHPSSESFVERKFFSRFPFANGVKQGGVLSLILFCAYIDVLLTQLKEAGAGCL